ncbi:MAG: MBOAT family protein [Acidimicrobiia bacterium]|nr:MBOAT family protein [Acidimicrobiia bacterium]
MLFPTVAFAVFFVVAFLVNWLLRPHHHVWLLAVAALSFAFYGYAPGSRRFVLLLLASALANWLFGEAIARALGPDRTRTPASIRLVRAAVVTNLAVLGYFKYYGWLADGLLPFIPYREIVLPVAISFFTFHALSYVIDIGRGVISPMRLDEFALYLSFFPHLVAGPIVRASEFQPQLREPADPRRIPFAEASRLIVAGLFKKVVVSSYLATEIVDPVFGAPAAHGPLELLVAVYAYAIQIYADFSGYTDIAIGCALLLGIRFPQNFDAPYRALSLQDFWRRWHMTLSRWLRDYLYIPLGGNRKGERRTYVNLGLTMVIGGLWHGAAWTFVIWGAIHGGFLAVERWVRERWRASYPDPVLPAAASGVLRWVLTFHVVCLAWIFFRADSFATASDVIAGIVAGSGPAPLVTTLVLVTIGLALLSQFVPAAAVETVQRGFARWGPAAQVAALVIALTTIDVLGPDGVAPFIYFQF